MKQILKELFKKNALWITIEIIIISINVYLTTVPSNILGRIIDFLYDIQKNKSNIINLVYILLGSAILLLIIRTIWKMIDAKISRDIVKKLRDRLFQKMLKTDVSELQSIKNGKIMSYFVSDIKEVRKFASNVLTCITRFILNFVIVTWAMIKATNAKLTIVSLCPIVISIILIICMIKRLERNYNDSRRKFTDLSEFVQESTDSIRTTKAYCGEQKQLKDFIDKNTDLKITNFEVIKSESLISIFTNLGIGIGIGLSILYGCKLVANNIISVGDFVAFNGYMLLLQSPITYIPWMIKHIKKVQVSYKRLDNMFKLKEEKIYTEEIQDAEKLHGDIEVKNLTYNYPGCVDKVLENINIKVKQGQSLGIIGVIGSGKTTLMNLLLKLYKVPNGTIFIDGCDINNIKTDIIRDNICYITQDNFLFSTTLKENINLFRDIYDENEILESTKSSMIFDEIEQMSDGINTVIGEKGIDLSGGQKQRVVISRAFLSKSNIVIFDDTFSALDNKTEQNLLTNIKDLTKNKTCIIVSNRISDIKHCDEIIVLDQGKIVERGVHKNLIKNKSKYYKFYKNQAEKTTVSILD